MVIGAARSVSEGVIAKLIEEAKRESANGNSLQAPVNSSGNQQPGKSFIDVLSHGIQEVNELQRDADKKSVDIVTGKSGDLHEAMLASTQAELSFNLMVQIRNKVLEAYQDVMRMPV